MCSSTAGYSTIVPLINLLIQRFTNPEDKAMKILHIDSSIQGAGSATRELTHEIVARLKATRPDAPITYRDLVAEEL